MKTLLVSCPKCGFRSLVVQEPAEITYNCFLRVAFTCNRCGYNGSIKVLKAENSEIEVVID